MGDYLKAIGLTSLIYQADKGVRLSNGELTPKITSFLTEEGIMNFLENGCFFAPIIHPWNGSTGFRQGDSPELINLLDQFSQTSSPRFGAIGKTITVARDLIFSDPEILSRERKGELIDRLRSTGPDQYAEWIDAVVPRCVNGRAYNPLLGTGGNDGNFEYGRSYLQALDWLFDLGSGLYRTQLDRFNQRQGNLLRAAVFGGSLPIKYFGKLGQNFPLENQEGRQNPWDLILMLHGCSIFCGRTREVGLSLPWQVFPFCTYSSAGYGSFVEAENSRGEFWAPRWQRFCSFGEIKDFARNFRAQVNTNNA